MAADKLRGARRGRIAPFLFTAFSIFVLCSAAAYMRGGAFFANALTGERTTQLIDPPWREAPPNFHQPAGHQRMLAELVKCHQYELDSNSMLGENYLTRLRKKLANAPQGMTEKERFLQYHELGMEELSQGNDRVAIDYLNQCRDLFEFIHPQLSSDEARTFVFNYGLANLRFGETQNCCSRKGPDNCVVPIQGSGIHTKQEGSRRAIEVFTEYLENTSPESKDYWRAMWLLNIAHMTINTYPAAVPQPFLIPPQSFESEEPFPRFPNIAERVGLDLYGLAGAVTIDDFNNDGHLDVVISGWNLGTQIRLFLNNRDGTFTEHTKQAGLIGILGGSNSMQADYDNDGFLDLMLVRGGWQAFCGCVPVSLLHNNGDGTFTDVTFPAGLGQNAYPSQSGGWADYDNDGFLDFFACSEYRGKGDFNSVGSGTGDFAPCQLFHNNGDGTFTEIAEQAGVTNPRFAKGASWGDYDNDGFPDLYVSNYGKPNALFHNNGDGTFTDVAVDLDVTRPITSFPCWFWDVNNDGLLDIYCAAFAAEPEDLALSSRGKECTVERACLYLGKPGGGFEEVSKSYNLLRPNAPMGANFGDLDNDGYLDFYLGTGRPSFAALMPNVMYHNRGGKGFADVTTAGGFGNLQKGHGVSFADLDNDGDQDVFEQMGGAIRADKFYDTLYENPGFGKQWLGIKLVGTMSNRSAIGARIRADITENGVHRSVYKWVNSGGSFGASPLRQTIGLGSASQVDRLEIYWPTTGKTDTFEHVPAGKYIRIVEGDRRISEIPLQSYRLGGGDRSSAAVSSKER